MKTIIGIDTGVSGGIAWHRDGYETGVKPMPETEGDVLDMIRALCAMHPVEVYIEQNTGFVGVPVPSNVMFTMARNVGFIHGVIATLGCRVIEVRPQVWQKALGLGVSGKVKADYTNCSDDLTRATERKRVQGINAGVKRDWKNKLKDKAQKLFPEHKVTLKTADALLILEYGKMTTKL